MQDSSDPTDAFIAQQLAQTLTLGAILPAAPRDGIQNGLRAGAQVGPQSGFGRTVEWTGFDDHTPMNLGEDETRMPRSQVRYNDLILWIAGDRDRQRADGISHSHGAAQRRRD